MKTQTKIIEKMKKKILTKTIITTCFIDSDAGPLNRQSRTCAK